MFRSKGNTYDYGDLMKKSFFILFLTIPFLCPISRAALPGLLTPLPKTDAIFTIGFHPVPKEIPPYYSEKSFMEIYPKLIPADVLIPVGGKDFWQTGVIVTKDKKVLWWRTCANSFIAIDSELGTSFYAMSKKLEIK
jgi:hypothetical protein